MARCTASQCPLHPLPAPTLRVQSAQGGGAAQGAMFWTWYALGQHAPDEEGGAAGGLFGEHAAASAGACPLPTAGPVLHWRPDAERLDARSLHR